MVEKEQMWLKQLEEGKDNAYRLLFGRFYARLCAFALKYVEEHGVAEDIVQEVLYELWLGKTHFETVLALRAYLYRVVRRRSLDVLKHRKVEKKYLEEQQYKEDSEFFLQQILEEEVYVLLKEALKTLPGPTRKVFELSLNGHDNTEIAEILHLTLDAVKSHKKRGKKILQEKMKGFIYLFALFDA